MITIARLFSGRARRSARAQQTLVEAYTHVFEGGGTAQEADLVLVDLARHSRYYYTSTPDTSNREVWFNEGQRAMFARIVRMLNLPSEARDRLASAVMLEEAATAEEGNEL